MTFLGIRRGPIGNNYQGAGEDPRNRYRRYIAQMQAQRAEQSGTSSSSPQRRGGAQPYPADEPPLASADALDELYGQADPMQQYLTGIAQGDYAPPERPIHGTGFQAPGRRLFARRGYRGRLNPGDEMTVGENGPEQLKVATPAQVQVTPNPDDQLITEPSNGDQYVLGAPMTGRVSPGAVGQSQEAAPGFRPQDLAAARVEAARRRQQQIDAANERGMGQRADQELADAAKRRLQGKAGNYELASGAVEDFQSYQRGDKPAYAYNNDSVSPSVRRAVMEDAQNGVTPRRGNASPSRLRQSMADDQLLRSRRVGESDEDFRMRLEDAGVDASQIGGIVNNNPAIAPKSAESIALGEAANERIRTRRAGAQAIIDSRNADKRDAIETFGTDRPMAVGALKERRQNRLDRLAVTDATLQAQVAASAVRGGGQAGLDQYTKTRDSFYKKNIEAGDDPDTAMKRAEDAARPYAPSGGAGAVDQQKFAVHSAEIAGAVKPLSDLYDNDIESNISLAEGAVDRLEKSDLPEEQKRILATATLREIDSAWKSPSLIAHPITGMFYENGPADKRRKAVKARIRAIAEGRKIAATPPAAEKSPAPRGKPKRAGAESAKFNPRE